MPYTWWFYTKCGEFTGTGEFPAQRTSYAENVSIWWRHHDSVWWLGFCMIKGVSAGIWLLYMAHSRARYLSVHHDDVIRWKHFPRYWPFVRGIHRWIPSQRPETRNFDVFFDIRLNKRLSKQSWGWWFDTPSGPLLRHCNVDIIDGHSKDISRIASWNISLHEWRQPILSHLNTMTYGHNIWSFEGHKLGNATTRQSLKMIIYIIKDTAYDLQRNRRSSCGRIATEWSVCFDWKYRLYHIDTEGFSSFSYMRIFSHLIW